MRTMLAFELRRSQASATVVVEAGEARALVTHPGLERAREAVGEARLKVGDHGWRTATHYVDPCASLGEQFVARVGRRVPSRAYFKLVELATVCARPVRGSDVLLLCEAPGGFVQCAVDLGCRSWAAHSYHAPDAIRFRPLPRRNGGLLRVCERGDLLQDGACHDLMKQCAGKFDLVTCDGSGDHEHDHARCQASNCRLALRQALIARRSLRCGGDLVLKLFDAATLVDEATGGVLQLLTDWFERVVVCKPAASRASNGEAYAVCIGKRPATEEALRRDEAALLSAPQRVARLFAHLDPALEAQLRSTDMVREAQLAALRAALRVCRGECDAPADGTAEWWAGPGRTLHKDLPFAPGGARGS